MRARPGEAGGDAGELERRFQEALAKRAAVGIVERPAAVGGALEADAGQHAAVAHVLGDEDASVVDERVVGEARLDEQAEAVARAGVGGEIEVGLEDLREVHRELRGAARLLHGLEERARHLPRHDVHAHVGPRLGAAHLPAAVGRDHRVAEPRARLVAQRDRTAVEGRRDFQRVTRRELPEIGAARGQRGRDAGAGVALHPPTLERAHQRVAPPHVHRFHARAGLRHGRLGDDGRRRRDGGNDRGAREPAAAIEDSTGAQLDGQQREQHDATSHPIHYNRRATSANS